MAKRVYWCALAIDDAIAALTASEGNIRDRMLAALDAAAESQGMNGSPRRRVKKSNLSALKIPSEKQLAVYRKIVREELESFDMTWDMLIYGGNLRPAVDCRWRIIWRTRNEAEMSFPAIGKLLEIDHSTAVNAFQRMEQTGGTYYARNPLSESKMIENKGKLKKIDERLQCMQA
jgi:chromosomal replication initiation ATPase DnaA